MKYSTILKKNKNRSGYSLVEVLIAAGILIVAVAAVAVIISRGSKINREDMLRRRAFQVMEEVLGQDDLHYINYPVLLNLIRTDRKIRVENPYQVTLYDTGEGEPVTATVQRILTKKLFSDPGGGVMLATTIPCIEVKVRIEYENNKDSLSTIITSTKP